MLWVLAIGRRKLVAGTGKRPKSGPDDPAELKGPGKLLRIRPDIADLMPKSAPKPNEAKPKMPGAVPTNWREPIPIDFGAVSVSFDHDPKLLHCEITQPSPRPAPSGGLPPLQTPR